MFRHLLFAAAFLSLGTLPLRGASPDEWFRRGVEAYNGGDFSTAAKAFSESAAQRPASGTLQNLGLAEWYRNRIGPAIQAWEQALWVDPFNDAARLNLRFARKTAQLEAPEAAWYEIASMWLPVNWWAWIAGVSLWFTVGMVDAAGVPALAQGGLATGAGGGWTRGVSVQSARRKSARTRGRASASCWKRAPPSGSRPHEEAQTVTQLAPGEPARWERVRGKYLFVRTSHGAGWLEKNQFGLLCTN